MDVEYTGRQTTITKKLKLLTETELARIVKIVGSSGSVHVILSTDKYRQIAEVTVQTRHHKLVARCEATEMETRAARCAGPRLKTRRFDTRRGTGPSSDTRRPTAKAARAEAAATPVTRKTVTVKVAAKTSVGRKAVPMLVHSFPSHSPLAEPHVVRSTDGVALRPMSLEEAVKEAAFRDRDVFVFRDHGGQAMVLHRKRDGKMELIEVP